MNAAASALFAITSRGLEAVAAREIALLPHCADISSGYRRVAMRMSGPLAPVLGLRTVDDCFLDVGTWQEVAHTRSALAVMRERATGLELPSAVSALRSLRAIPPRPAFAVTVNFVGARNYTGDEIKQAVGEAIQERWGWEWAPRDDAAQVNLRLFIEHGTVHVGVRVGATPLHERAYKRHHLPGSLRPPVAAAMVALSGAAAQQEILDPCCGSGTILIEASSVGAHVRGGDLDATALATAQANVAAASLTVDLHCWDLRALPLPDGSIDHVICNLPWGRQVEVDAGLIAFHEQSCREIARVLRPGGTATLLTIHPELVAIPGRQRVHSLEISLQGQLPRIVCER